MSCQMNETKAILQKFQAQSLHPTFGSPSKSLPFVSQMFFGCISDQGESTWPSNLRRGAWIFQLVSRLERTQNDTPWSVQLFGVLKGLTRNSRQRVKLPFGPFGRFISIQCIDLAIVEEPDRFPTFSCLASLASLARIHHQSKGNAILGFGDPGRLSMECSCRWVSCWFTQLDFLGLHFGNQAGTVLPFCCSMIQTHKNQCWLHTPKQSVKFDKKDASFSRQDSLDVHVVGSPELSSCPRLATPITFWRLDQRSHWSWHLCAAQWWQGGTVRRIKSCSCSLNLELVKMFIV